MIGCYRLKDGKWERFDVISKAKSIIWTKRFYEVGSFQIEIKSNIFQKYDIVTYEEKSGIVMKTQETSYGCTVFGYDLKGITHFRRMESQTISKGSAEAALRGVVTTYLLTDDRAIEGLSLGKACGSALAFSEDISVTEGEKLSEFLEKQCKAVGIGWDISFDKGLLTFSFTEARNNEDIVFDEKSRMIEEAEHVFDAYDEVNNSGSGIFRREGDSEEKASDYITGTATEKAANFLLGDKVKIKALGYEATQQITQIQYVYEPNNIMVLPVFGEIKKNIIKKLMKG